MKRHVQNVEESAAFLRNHITAKPEIGILTGTGLGDAATALEPEVHLPYQEIPHFPVSTAAGHAGQLLFGIIGEKPAMVFQGRFHLYEGYSPLEVTHPIRVMQQLGIRTVILTNAAGGLNPAFKEGEIMAVRDHINLTGGNPLTGANPDLWGIRFPDMTAVYDPLLITAAKKVAQENSIPFSEGVYAGLAGPSLETPAETRFLRTIGADAVGFSTVHEAIAAAHARMRIMALSLITNLNDPDSPKPTTVEQVLAVAGQAAPRLAFLLEKIVEAMDEPT